MVHKQLHDISLSEVHESIDTTASMQRPVWGKMLSFFGPGLFSKRWLYGSG